MIIFLSMANALLRLHFLDNGRAFSFYMLATSIPYGTSTTTEPTGDVSTGSVQPHWQHATTSWWPLEDRITIKRTTLSFISGVKKRCREEATPIPTIYDEEIGGLRNIECDDSVEDMIRNIPTSQACKSSLYRNHNPKVTHIPGRHQPRGTMDLYFGWWSFSFVWRYRWEWGSHHHFCFRCQLEPPLCRRHSV